MHAMTRPPFSIYQRTKPAGTLALVGITLLLALPIKAQVNLGFEINSADAPAVPGWRARNDDIAAVLDASIARGGTQSLRVDSSGDDDRRGFSQVIDSRDLAGDRVRVSAYAKLENPTSAIASLRVRVDGPDGLLYIARTQQMGAEDAAGWQRIVIDAPISARAERISFGGEVTGGSTVWFDDFRIEALYARTLPVPSNVASRYVERALEVIDEHAVNRAQLNWPAYRGAVLEQARGAVTTVDAHLAVQYALAGLGDGHSYFMSPRQMDNLADRPVGNARTARALRAPEAELLPDGIGYLRLPGIAGGEHGDRVVFAETVQGLIAEFDTGASCGWILDLRDNQGGNLWPMLAGVGPLLGNGEVGFSLRPDGERRSIWYADGKAGLGDYVQLRVRGEPVRLRNPNTPVAVILNDETASAAEIIASAFAGRTATRSFGAATGGATSATRTFPLSDGAALMLAVASVTDRSGRPLGGHIQPNELCADAASGQALNDQDVIRAARRWLLAASGVRGESGCRLAGDSASQAAR